MNGTVDRRNDPFFWIGRITWTKLKLKQLPPCDDCLINVHAAGGTQSRVTRAAWRRRNVGAQWPYTATDVEKTTVLCSVHRQEWIDWTPGQMVIGS